MGYKKIDIILKKLHSELRKEFAPHHFSHTKVFQAYYELVAIINEGKVEK